MRNLSQERVVMAITAAILTTNALFQPGFIDPQNLLAIVLDPLVPVLGVLVIHSYLTEITNVSNRILVSRLDRVLENVTPGKVTEEELTYATVH